MNTILEFMEFTKGMSYLIAVAFLIGFVAFWLLIFGRGKKLAIKIIPLAVLMLLISGLVSTSILRKPVETVSPEGEEISYFSPTVLVALYGPASFDHESHQIIEDCTVCHHHSGDETPRCNECHGEPFDPGNLNKPGLAHVFHLRCISCHKEEQVGPTECTGCHHEADIPPLSVAHPLSGIENCLKCHMDGISGVPKIPADHTAATNGVCELCHKTEVDADEIAERALPHDIEDMEDCLMCHGEGIVGATKVPADHAGKTNETCQLCHKTEQELETIREEAKK